MIKDEYETERKVHSSVGGLACLVLLYALVGIGRCAFLVLRQGIVQDGDLTPQRFLAVGHRLPHQKCDERAMPV